MKLGEDVGSSEHHPARLVPVPALALASSSVGVVVEQWVRDLVGEKFGVIELALLQEVEDLGSRSIAGRNQTSVRRGLCRRTTAEEGDVELTDSRSLLLQA
jgi:hypothetical protein